MNRRTYLTLVGGTAAAASTGLLGRRWHRSDAATSRIRDGPTIAVTELTDGLTEPVAVEFHPDAGYTYIADKVGHVRLLRSDGLVDEPFLDVTDRLLSDPTSWEQGLLGFTLHPEFASNRRFYVRYSAPLLDAAPAEFSHTFVLSEFRATEEFTRAPVDSERVLLEIPQPGKFHQAGAIAFGPDGYLYVAVGDGGSHESAAFGGFGDAGPGHPPDWYWVNRGGNGQDLTHNLLGSILRIDVDTTEGEKPYGIPPDNPLVGTAGLDEQYAWGFRNPYRMSFDGDRLFVGDVGRNLYEEVNVVTKGGNYGWNVREGPSCFNGNSVLTGGVTDDVPNAAKGLFERPPLSHLDTFAKHFGLRTLPRCPSETPDGDPLIDPAVVYSHEQLTASAVIGGYVYRNATVEALRDTYVFADLAGGLFASAEQDRLPWDMEAVTVAGTETGRIEGAVLSFGRDPTGELYVLTTAFSEGSGKLWKIVPA